MTYTEAIEHAITALQAATETSRQNGFTIDEETFLEAYKTLQQYLERHEDN